MTYAKKVFIAVDQLINAVFLNGYPDETLSSRAWRWYRDDVFYLPMLIIDAIFFWQEEHCKSSYESERADRQLPPEFRVK